MHFVRGTSAALFAHGAAVGRPSKDGSVLPASLQHHIHIFYADRVRDVQDACRTLATSPGLWRQRRAGSAVNTKCSFKYSTRRVRHSWPSFPQMKNGGHHWLGFWTAVLKAKILFSSLMPLGHRLRANVWEANHIVDDIYLGSVDDAANLQALRDERGITHVVCCVLGLRPLYPGQFKYLLVPLRDEPDESLEPYFDQTVRFIDAALASGGRVFVHCMKGVSRSASMVVAWLVARKGMEVEEAIEFLQSKRPAVSPNEGFRAQLRLFAASLRDRLPVSHSQPSLEPFASLLPVRRSSFFSRRRSVAPVASAPVLSAPHSAASDRRSHGPGNDWRPEQQEKKNEVENPRSRLSRSYDSSLGAAASGTSGTSGAVPTSSPVPSLDHEGAEVLGGAFAASHGDEEALYRPRKKEDRPRSGQKKKTEAEEAADEGWVEL